MCLFFPLCIKSRTWLVSSITFTVFSLSLLSCSAHGFQFLDSQQELFSRDLICTFSLHPANSRRQKVSSPILFSPFYLFPATAEVNARLTLIWLFPTVIPLVLWRFPSGKIVSPRCMSYAHRKTMQHLSQLLLEIATYSLVLGCLGREVGLYSSRRHDTSYHIEYGQSKWPAFRWIDLGFISYLFILYHR